MTAEATPDDDGSLLYDVLVFKEWISAGAARQRRRGSSEMPASLLSRLLPSALSSSGGRAQGVPSLESALALRSEWNFAVVANEAEGGVAVAVLHGGVIEVLAHSYSAAASEESGASPTGSFVTIGKASVPPDPQPELSTLTWSPGGRLLLYTASNGRCFVYDESCAPVYSILSQNLPAWGGPSDIKASYAGVFFSSARLVKSREWISEAILVDFGGRINSFLLSYSGYQDFASLSAAEAFPGGVTAATYCASSGLLILAGHPQRARGSCQIAAWRMVDEAPYFKLALEKDDPEPSSNFFSSLLPSVLGRE